MWTDEAKVATALVAGSVAVVVFTLRTLVEQWRDWRGEYIQDRQMSRGLHAEIRFNCEDLETFVGNPLTEAQLRAAFLAPPDGSGLKRPHLTDGRHIRFYEVFLERLPRLPPIALAEVVRFYHYLEKIKVIIDGVQVESFADVSVDGKLNVIRHLFDTAADASKCGRRALHLMEIHAPVGWRLDDFAEPGSSHNDRVRATHPKSPETAASNTA